MVEAIRKECPECGHVFKGSGWDGIDAHWRSKHEAVMPYEDAWPLIKSGQYARPALAEGAASADFERDHSEWEALVKGLLKAELKKRGITYAQLVEKLGEIGIHETEPNLRNKLSRGSFTAVFFVQCLTAIGAETLRLRG